MLIRSTGGLLVVMAAKRDGKRTPSVRDSVCR